MGLVRETNKVNSCRCYVLFEAFKSARLDYNRSFSFQYWHPALFYFLHALTLILTKSDGREGWQLEMTSAFIEKLKMVLESRGRHDWKYILIKAPKA